MNTGHTEYRYEVVDSPPAITPSTTTHQVTMTQIPVTPSDNGQQQQSNNQNNNTSSQVANNSPQTGQNNRQTTLIQNMLSNTQAVPPEEFQFNGKTFRRIKTHFRVTYNLACEKQDMLSQDLCMSLADRGCNGGFLGEDARILSIKENSFADIIGMNNSLVNQAPIGTGALKINTTNGPIIGIFN